MIKQFLKISFYSAILFCVISFASLIISMLKSKLEGTFPNFSMGFPYNFYYQFMMRNNDFHHGGGQGILLDFLVCIILVVLYQKINLSKKT